MKISITPCTGDHPLYQRYPQQCNPQDAYISLYPADGDMYADWNAEIGNAIPMTVYHGIHRRYKVSEYLTSNEINSLMEEITPLAKRVCDGFEVVWDGHNNVGRLNEDAMEAEDELRELCSEKQSDSEIDPEEADAVFEVPEFAELLEQFHAEKFNANTFPTAAQVTDILCELWTEDDGTTLERNTLTGQLHKWDTKEELPDGPEWHEKLLDRLGFDQFREPVSICRGGNGDVIWFLENTDKEVSEILDALREEAEELEP